jgi:hypothetical protein
MSCSNQEPRTRLGAGEQAIYRDLGKCVSAANAARAAALAPVNIVTRARRWLIGLSTELAKTPGPSPRQF